MFIKSLGLKNFRCFEDIKIGFNPEYSVIVGVNGSGKSTILDALAKALGSYIAGFDGISSNGISAEDAHRKMYQLGSRIEAEPQFPVEISADMDVDGTDISWQRILERLKGRTLITPARSVMEYAKQFQEEIRKGNSSVILPVVAYYGTGRLYMQKKDTAGEMTFTRTAGYADCLDSASNDKRMLKWFKLMTSIELQEGKKVPELEAVKRAMGMCYAGKDHPDNIAQFQYSLKSDEIEISYTDYKGDIERLPMHMLSDGLRVTLSMVADIAYRMAVLNPQLLDRTVAETPGIVLIDEVDMHLHPSWQKRIMDDLHYIFPRVQFIVTTHAPSILANIKAEHILLLEDGKVYSPNNTTYGRDIGDIMREMMKVNGRPEKVVKLQEHFYNVLDQGDMSAAKRDLDELTNVLGENDADVVKAKVAYDLETM